MTQTTTIKAYEPARTIQILEGQSLTISGSAGAVGVAYLLDAMLGGMNAVKSWNIGSGSLSSVIGPFANSQLVHITCQAGQISATTQDAVLTVSGAVAAVITGSGIVNEYITATLPAGVVGTLQFTKTLKASPFTKSNISGAVANAVNSLQYKVLLADLPYKFGCDSSNTVSPSNTIDAVAASTGGDPATATAITLTGPTAATAGVESSAYTVTLSPVGGTLASPITATPTPVTGVTFSPASLTLSTASPSGTFTATASTAGTKVIAVTSSGGLTAPAAINLVVAAAGGGATAPSAPTLGDISAGDGVVVVPLSANGDGGSPITGFTGTFGGVNATAPANATEMRFTGVTNGAVGTASIKAVNNVAPSAAAVSDPIRPAAGLVANELTRMVISYPAYSNANSVYEPLGSMNTNFPAASGGGIGTCMLIAELQADASHIQLIVGNAPNNAQPRTIVGATCAVSPTLADKTMDAAFASSLDFTFGGNAGVTIPAVAGTQTFANIALSDWLPITTVARTDIPGAPPIVAFREAAMYPDYNNGQYGVPYATLNGAQWGTDRGVMLSKCRSGDTRKSAHGAAAGTGSTCTILGFRYRLKNGTGVTVAWFGSSITNSDIGGLVKRPFSYGGRAASLSSTSAMPVEYINGGQTGQTQDKAAACAESYLPLLKPTHTVIEFCNVNNISVPNAGAFSALRTANDRIIAAANTANSRVAIYNSYTRNVAASPTDTSYYDAAGDAARLAFHAEYKALGYPLLNTNTFMSDGASPSALPMISKGAAGNFTAIGDGVHHHTYSDTNVLIPRATAFVGRLRDRYFGV